jgi:hypothetical protein
MAVVDSPGIGNQLRALPWRVFGFPETAQELMTSDRPVFQDHKNDKMYLALPVGPRKLFVAGTLPALDAIARRPVRQLAKEVNRIVVSRAHRFVYASSDAQLDFVARHFGTSPEPRAAELGAWRTAQVVASG